MKNKYLYLLLLILMLSFIFRISFVETTPSNQDATFYHKAAVDLSHFSIPSLNVNNEVHPTMIFLGYPFILAIFYTLFGDSYLIGVTITTLFGILSLFLIYQIGKKLFNPLAGLIASVILAFSSLHLILGTTILSDIPSLALMLLAVYIYLGYNGKYKYYIFGALIGINFFVRASSIILLLLPLMYNILNKRKYYQDYRKLFLSFIPFILLFLYVNYNLYDSPFTSGYAYYEEKFNFINFFDASSPFPSFIGETLQEKLGGILFYAYSLFHGGYLIDSYGSTNATFSKLVIILLVISLFRMKSSHDKFKILILLFALLNLLLYSFQTYYGVRYMILTYSLFVLLAAGELEYLARRFIKNPLVRAISISSLLLLIIIPSIISAMPYLSFFHNVQFPIINTIKFLDKNADSNSIIITDYFVQFNYYSNKTVVPIRMLDESSVDKLISKNSNIYFIEDYYTQMKPTKCFEQNMVPGNISETRIRTKHCKIYTIINRHPTSGMVLNYVLNKYNTTLIETPFEINYYRIN